MRFNVQTISKIGLSYEIDLVDDQMSSDYQSSITLRVDAKHVKHYHIGQMFVLASVPEVEADMNESRKKYYEENFTYNPSIFQEE